jgi:hypothetical protein
MMKEALHPRDPELIALAEAAGLRARGVAAYVVRTAFQKTPVPDQCVADGLALLRGDLREVARILPRLRSIAQSLDEAYLAAGGPARPEAQENFSRARAVSALIAALGADPVEATIGAIYEAQASLSETDADSLMKSVRTQLRQIQAQ